LSGSIRTAQIGDVQKQTFSPKNQFFAQILHATDAIAATRFFSWRSLKAPKQAFDSPALVADCFTWI
jgi:hypothetical protein